MRGGLSSGLKSVNVRYELHLGYYILSGHLAVAIIIGRFAQSAEYMKKAISIYHLPDWRRPGAIYNFDLPEHQQLATRFNRTLYLDKRWADIS
jgi:hypothetical protein